MISVETCATCWRYDRLLRYHLSALVLYPPAKTLVRCTVCYSSEDELTVDVLEHFGKVEMPNVTWNWHEMDRERLMRREISRHEIATTTTADFLMFTDIDYLFRGTVIDSLADEMAAATRREPKLMYIRNVLSSRSHEDGDAEIERADCNLVIDVEDGRYSPAKIPRAIGGCQFLPGRTANGIGYLGDHARFQKPSERFRRCFGDTVFRKTCGVSQCQLKSLGVYRIRHSDRGRVNAECRL